MLASALLTINAINSHHNRNSEFKIITRGRKGLRATNSVSETKLMTQEYDKGECNNEIDDQRRHDAQNVNDLVDDVFTLRCEEDYDGED